MPQAAQGTEGMAGFPGPEQDHQRLQRDLSPAGDDGQQGHDGTPLGENCSDHWTYLRCGVRELPAERPDEGPTPDLQGGH